MILPTIQPPNKCRASDRKIDQRGFCQLWGGGPATSFNSSKLILIEDNCSNELCCCCIRSIFFSAIQHSTGFMIGYPPAWGIRSLDRQTLQDNFVGRAHVHTNRSWNLIRCAVASECDYVRSAYISASSRCLPQMFYQKCRIILQCRCLVYLLQRKAVELIHRFAQ
jgi:hypothetical protein